MRHWDVQYYSDTHCDVPALQVKVVEYKGRSAYTLLECPSVFSVTGCREKKSTWSAPIAALWNRKSVLKSWAISRTRRWNGSLRISSSVDFWYLLISRRATVPGLYLWGFFTPPVDGALLRAALVASCLRGALPPVDLRAVCLVRAILKQHITIVVLKISYKHGWQDKKTSWMTAEVSGAEQEY